MTEYQRAIDEIQAYVQSRNWAVTPAIRAAAAPYAQACQEANRRLGQCAAFIRQGHLAEALHLAEAEPALLDLVAMLDFPEREQWQELASANGLSVPAALNLEFAEAINKAYATAHPLEKLLRKHRILALARADLRLRIETMRELSVLDTSSPVWKEDIAVFEKARLHQIESELKELMSSDDTEKIRALDQELQNAPWSIVVPPALKSTVARRLDDITKQGIRAELEQVKTSLLAAQAAGDVARGRSLRTKWERLYESGALGPKTPLASSVVPALKWLEREDAKASRMQSFSEAVADLENAFQDTTTSKELEARYQAVSAFSDFEIPRELVGRYYRTFNDRKKNEAGYLRRIVISACAIALIVLCGIGYAIRSSMQSTLAAEGTEKLSRALETGNLKQARDELDRLERDSPGLAGDFPGLEAVKKRLVDAETTDKARLEELTTVMDAAGRDPIPPVESPNLTRARKLARNGEERTKIKELETEREQKIALWSAPFESRLKDAGNELAALKSGASWDEKRFDKLTTELGQLNNLLRMGPVALHNELEALTTNLANLGHEKEEIREKQKALAEVTRAASDMHNLNDFATKLEQFNHLQPSSDYVVALREKQLWADVPAWSDQLFQAWSGSLSDIDAVKAQQKLTQLEKVNARFRDIPAFDSVIAMRRALSAVANQSLTDGELREYLQKPTVKDLWVFVDQDGVKGKVKRYYLTENSKKEWEKSNEHAHPVRILNARDGAQVSKTLIWNSTTPPKQAKHSLLAKAYLEKQGLGTATARDWEAAVVELIDQIRSDEEMDPLLRIWMLQGVLNIVRKGSSFLHEATADLVSKIETARINFAIAPWMASDDKNPAIDTERKRATDLLQALPTTKNLLKKVGQSRDLVERKFWDARLVPVGWLYKDGAVWQCRSTVEVTAPAGLCVVYPEGGNAVCVPIGKTKPPSQFDVFGGKPAALVAGRRVFMQAGPR